MLLLQGSSISPAHPDGDDPLLQGPGLAAAPAAAQQQGEQEEQQQLAA